MHSTPGKNAIDLERRAKENGNTHPAILKNIELLKAAQIVYESDPLYQTMLLTREKVQVFLDRFKVAYKEAAGSDLVQSEKAGVIFLSLQPRRFMLWASINDDIEDKSHYRIFIHPNGILAFTVYSNATLLGMCWTWL